MLSRNGKSDQDGQKRCAKAPQSEQRLPGIGRCRCAGVRLGEKLLSRRDLVPGLYGDPERPLKAEHIRVTNRLLGVSVLFTLLGTLVLGLVAATGGSLWL